MRIGLHTNPPTQVSGYATQGEQIAAMLVSLGHQVWFLSNSSYTGRPLIWPLNLNGERVGIADILPGAPTQADGHSQRLIRDYGAICDLDLVIAFCDAHPLQPDLWGDVPVIAYFPVDHEPMLKQETEPLRRCAARICYSMHGLQQALDARLEATFIPHVVDPTVFSPPAGNVPSLAARRHFDIPDDAFVIGMVAANNDPSPTRKNWENQLAAVGEFQKRYPRAHLLLHTDLRGRCPLMPLLLTYGIRYTHLPVPAPAMVTNEEMLLLYHAMDVLLAVSAGEGCGLPILEAGACGIPVITGDWTAMGEYHGGPEPLLLKKAEDERFPLAALTWNEIGCAYRYYAKPERILDCLEAAEALSRAPDLAAIRREITRTIRNSFNPLTIRQDWDEYLRKFDAGPPTERTIEIQYGGGLGDVFQQLYHYGWHQLADLKPHETANVRFISHNPLAAKLLSQHPKRDQIVVRSYPYWTPEEDAAKRREFGIPPPPAHVSNVPGRPIEFYPTADDYEAIHGIPKIFGDDWSRFIVFSISAGEPNRNIPLDIARSVAMTLQADGYVPLIVGATYARHDRAEQPLILEGEYANLIDKLTPSGLGHIIQRCRGVVCCHSAVNMLAWLERKPQLLLYPESVKKRHFEKPDQWSFGANFPECSHGLFSDWADRFARFRKALKDSRKDGQNV